MDAARAVLALSILLISMAGVEGMAGVTSSGSSKPRVMEKWELRAFELLSKWRAGTATTEEKRELYDILINDLKTRATMTKSERAAALEVKEKLKIELGL